MRSTFGKGVTHRTTAYRNNGLEQGHRGIKGRVRCMRDFKRFTSADRLCQAYDELRSHLRPRARHNQSVSASRSRLLHVCRAIAALAILGAA
ncbi:DDE-type integrase/transposase/recombinase [Roseomonas xinghualingensis]|uniref:DDE-type integrase/transposase/recombinase n=1 Tax=Roseomonas xinghualingensis TaxID=2986475 RepID=UPI00366BB1F7